MINRSYFQKELISLHEIFDPGVTGSSLALFRIHGTYNIKQSWYFLEIFENQQKNDFPSLSSFTSGAGAGGALKIR